MATTLAKLGSSETVKLTARFVYETMNIVDKNRVYIHDAGSMRASNINGNMDSSPLKLLWDGHQDGYNDEVPMLTVAHSPCWVWADEV